MRIFPSIPAAIVAGAIVMPLFIRGWRFIETTYHSQTLLLLWLIVGFFVPIAFSTGDMRDVFKRWRDEGIFSGYSPTREDFKLFLIPAWTRMFVCFVSAVISILVLKSIGIVL